MPNPFVSQQLMNAPHTAGILLLQLPQGQVLQGNTAFCSMTGHGKPTDLVLSALVVGESATLTQLQGMSAGASWQGELPIRCLNGSTLWTLVSASCFQDEQEGNLLLLILQDFCQQKQLLMDAELNRQLQQRAQKLALIGHWQLDLQTGELVFGTEELYRIFGLPLGAPLSEFDKIVHPEDRESVNKIMQMTLQSGGVYDSTYRLVTSQNQRKWVHAIGEGVFDHSGKLVAIAGSVQDITAFREVEEELIKMQKLKSLGLLAGGIAHDFNNIHTVLFGNIAMVKSHIAADQPGYKELAVAEKALERANQLSNQLLTFAKGGEPVRKLLNLEKLVADVVRFDMAGSKSSYHLDVQSDLWQVYADPGQVEQVFANLVINACQAMPHGGTMRITMSNAAIGDGEHPHLAAGAYASIKLEDSGIGIAKDDLLQIFDPYFTTKQAGSGLGLATAYSIVSRHGGHIEVSSEPGVGTTFLIYLPAMPEAEAVSEEPDSNELLSLSSLRVLVMDDEKEVGLLLQKVLALDGLDVEVTCDGQAAIHQYALAMSQGRPFDCVIMDLVVPGGMGGKEAVKGILQLDPAATVIVSSGYADDPVLASFSHYGFKGVMAKPYTPASVRRLVRELLSPK